MTVNDLQKYDFAPHERSESLAFLFVVKCAIVSAVNIDNYKRALESAQKALGELLKVRETLDRQISKVEAAAVSLADLISTLEKGTTESAPQENLREAIRLVFKNARPNPLSPTEVRDKLKEMGFQLDRYRYELPPIHNTINRLLGADEIETVAVEGTRKFKWVGIWTRAARRANKDDLSKAVYANLYGKTLSSLGSLEPPDADEHNDISGEGIPIEGEPPE